MKVFAFLILILSVSVASGAFNNCYQNTHDSRLSNKELEELENNLENMVIYSANEYFDKVLPKNFYIKGDKVIRGMFFLEGKHFYLDIYFDNKGGFSHIGYPDGTKELLDSLNIKLERHGSALKFIKVKDGKKFELLHMEIDVEDKKILYAITNKFDPSKPPRISHYRFDFDKKIINVFQRADKRETDYLKMKKSYFGLGLGFSIGNVILSGEKFKEKIRDNLGDKLEEVFQESQLEVEDSQINDMVDNIIDKASRKTQNFKGNHRTSAIEVFKITIDDVLDKVYVPTLKDTLPEKDHKIISIIKNNILNDINNCLDKSKEKDSIRLALNCLDTFKNEIKVSTVEQLLEFYLSNLGLNSLTDIITKDFYECFKEHSTKAEIDSIDVLKGCAMLPIMKNTDEVLDLGINFQLKKLEEEKGLRIIIDEQSRERYKRQLRKCLVENKIIDNNNNYDFVKLSRLEPINCSNNILVNIVNDGIANFMENNLVGEMKLTKRDVDAIGSAISEQVQVCRSKVGSQELFDPESCNNSIAKVSFSEGVKRYSNMVGSNVYDNIKDMPYIRDENIDDIQSLKDVTTNIFGELPADILKYQLKNIDVFSDFNLSDDSKKLLNEKFKSCSKEEFKRYKTQIDLLGGVEAILNNCFKELMSSKEDRKKIIGPIIGHILNDPKLRLTLSEKEKLTDNLIREIDLKGLNKKIPQDFMKEFQTIAFDKTLDFMLEKSLSEVLPDNKDKISILKSKISKKFEKEIGIIKSKLFRNEDVSNEVEDFVIQGTSYVFDDVLDLKIDSLYNQKIITDNNQAQKLKDLGEQLFKKCLADTKKSKVYSFDKKIKNCSSKFLEEVIRYIAESNLEKEIKENKFLKKYVSKEEYENIKNNILGEDFINELKIILADTEQKKLTDSINKFGLKIKNKAIKQVSSIVVRKSLRNIISKQQVAEKIEREVLSDLGECLNNNNHEFCLNDLSYKLFEESSKQIYKNITYHIGINEDRNTKIVDDGTNALKQCMNSKEKNIKMSDYMPHINGCLVANINYIVDKNIEMLKDNKELLKLDDSINNRWSKCSDDLKDKHYSTIHGNDNKNDDSSLSKIYTDIFKAGKIQLDSVLADLNHCLNQLYADFFHGYGQNLVDKYSFNEDLKKSTDKIDDLIEEVMSYKDENGNPVKLLFQNENTKEQEDSKSFIKILQELTPEVANIMKAAIDYNKQDVGSSILELKSDIKNHLENNNMTLSLGDLSNIIMKSSIVDLVIKSKIKSTLDNTVESKLKDYDIDTEDVKSIIENLYLKNADVINSLKEEFIKPALDANLTEEDSNKLLENNIDKITNAIIGNTDNGGLSEILAGEIIKKYSGISWKKYSKDINGSYRDTKEGREIIEYLSGNVIRPIYYRDEYDEDDSFVNKVKYNWQTAIMGARKLKLLYYIKKMEYLK